MTEQQVKKVCLMYSGGLDTSCMLKWIQEHYNAEIVTFTADLGQEMIDPSRFKQIEEKAKNAGAVASYTVDLKEEFVNEYIVPVIKSNAFYQGSYPLSTAVGRYLIAKKVVEIALKEGCDAVAHGSTGKGNDQVRLDVYVKAVAPQLKILRPMIEWGMGRDDEMKYAQKHGIPISNQNKKYSTDENLWGRSAECDILEHPNEVPPQDSLEWLSPPEQWPDEPEIIKIHFNQGIPSGLNDEDMSAYDVIEKVHKIAVKHGIGWVQSMEDRTIGLKSRETYEVPAAEILIKGHKALEKYVCTKEENSFKTMVDQKWTEMAYEGLWLDPLMDALNAFVNEVNKKATGWAKLRLFKGKAEVVAQDSPYGLYDLKLATYDTDSSFNQTASYGFIELFGLSTRMGYQMKQRAIKDLEKE
ncbi:MAG: argininosuccinate synthase [Candidatus Lokiarchaeota archaeon]|nr:argininosuccinate synthase [Candidatus Lokiarchaeota archaeon]